MATLRPGLGRRPRSRHHPPIETSMNILQVYVTAADAWDVQGTDRFARTGP